ncbi:MAG: aminopeptidase P N-terminal domain-containing protein [Deltaproteobacteria bacterium]|nr:aminopeptidase P N-terminal domain-containing protein [Deltaproteobacteria bacterium]
MDIEVFRARRQRLAEAYGVGTVLAVQSARHALRNHDVEHEWRQDSDFWYLTGFDEPECILVLVPGRAEGDAVVFVRPRDPTMETWNGRRAGVERAAQWIGVAQAFDVGLFDEEFSKLCAGARQVAWALGRDPVFDGRILKAARKHRTQPRLYLDGPDHFTDLALVLSEQRLHKSAQELDHLRRAAAITSEAHHEAMRLCAPGSNERQLQAAVEYVFRASGSDRVGYGSIVARGDNATILHYRENNATVRPGDLVLIDAGAEFGYVTADVTRTFPVDGQFSAAQRAVYEIVLDAEKRAIELCRPGQTVADVHDCALRVLTAGLVRLGVLQGDDVGQLVQDEAYKAWYMHRTSHWLGMDVHDTGRYHDPGSAPETGKPNRARTLAPGMVLTVEPGLYFAADDEKVPQAYRGIGVRIEDDVLVTDGAPEVLTAQCVKEIADVEAMVGTGGRYVLRVA